MLRQDAGNFKQGNYLSYGHSNIAGRKWMATTVTAVHHSIWQHLYDSMHAAQNPKSKLKVVTLDKESNMKSAARKIWRRRHK